MNKKWKTIIEPNTGLFDFKLKEVWNYRDLCLMFIRKNYITKYKQTVFGPLYLLLTPLLTSGIFSIVFGTIAGISTEGVPDFLFFMAGSLAWSFFSACVIENNNTFIGNSYIMGKVYFPRLVIPLANTITKMLNMLMQFGLFMIFYVAYYIGDMEIKPNIWIIASPLLLFMLGIMALGIGLIISALTVKYRDLNIIINFAMNLWMYATPVIYPLSNVPKEWRVLVLINPVSSIIETLRYAFFGIGVCSIQALVWSCVFTMGVIIVGLILFNRVEKNFIDTI